MAKMLVVDDELDICNFLKSFFVEKQYEVRTATGGEEALALARSEKPDVVLLDIKMPGMSGIEALRQLKEIDKKIKVIMVTAVEEISMVDLAKELGADDYITKPFSLAYLEKDVMRKLVDLLVEKAKGGKGS